jgi:hypothetical protein
MNLHSIIPTILIKQASEEYKLYYFEGRNTGIAARSEEEARAKKKRGGDKLVAVRTPSDSEKRLMESGKWVRTRYDGKPPGKSEVEGPGMGPPLKKKANPQQDSSTVESVINDNYKPESASGVANLYTTGKKALMVKDTLQSNVLGKKRLLTTAGALAPQLKAVGRVAQPVGAAIDTAMLVASPQARQNVVNEVEQNAKLNPALRMTKAYVNPVSTGYGIAAQTNQMVNSNNAALKSEQNYSNALDKRTTDAYYRNHYNQLLANRGLYTYPGTTRNQQNNAVPTIPQTMPNQIVKRSFILVPGFSKQAEDGGPKSDQEVSIITKPNKTPRNGFIRDPKTNRLMVQDRRFNLVQPKEEVIKAANKNLPARVLKAMLNNDTKALSALGKLGNKAKLDSKKSKAITDAFNMQKHLEHPDTKHFLSILDKENRLI